MQFVLEYNDRHGHTHRVPMPPSRSIALLDALPPNWDAHVISPNGHIWSLTKARAAFEEAVGDMGLPLDTPLPGLDLPQR